MHAGPAKLAFAIVTVSDSRSPATDTGGDLAERLVRAAGHDLRSRSLVRDETAAIVAALDAATGVDVVVFTGGTGLAPRDVTPDALLPRLDRVLPGFGELFRMLSFQEVGGAAMASRAEAGVSAGRLVFLLPGSPKAVGLAMERLVLPEASHLVGQMRR
jgi:molybdenum cofactor biosynthesis protein B